MYYWCIGSCTLHSCFPSYSGHHLSGAQPIRASSFWHQQAMGMAGGWGQPWHGSTRHDFLQAGHAHFSMPSWVLCSRNHSWAGIQMGPYSPGSRPNILGCCGEANRAQKTVKTPSQVPEKNLGDVFTLYFKCTWDVLTMNHTSIDGCISNWGLMQIRCITDVLEMYSAGICRVLIMYWQLKTSQYIIDVLIYVVLWCIHRCIAMYWMRYFDSWIMC